MIVLAKMMILMIADMIVNEMYEVDDDSEYDGEKMCHPFACSSNQIIYCLIQGTSPRGQENITKKMLYSF